jgi:hypothetical protein
MPVPRGHLRVIAASAVALCLMLMLGIVAARFGWQRSPEQPTPKVELASTPRLFVPQEAVDETGPSVQAKRAQQPVEARAKPPAPPPVAKAAVKTASAIPPNIAIAKSAAGTTLARHKPKLAGPAYDIEASLLSVPEADLDRDYLKRSAKQIAEKAAEIAKENKQSRDAFVKKLMKERTDLAGLPFLLGDDCAIAAEKARDLAEWSLHVREMIAEEKGTPRSPGSRLSTSASFGAEAVRAHHQILSAENRGLRIGLAVFLRDVKHSAATETMLKQAIFDLDPDVRSTALLSLDERQRSKLGDALSQSDYTAILKMGLRYPWQPVIENTLQTIATLERKEMVPDLVALMDQPDPRAPFKVKGDDGKEKTMVRELVRINHLRNCMLCHASVDSESAAKDRSLLQVPIGPAPSPEKKLPPSTSPVYYALRDGVTLVRADVTYLRQDFSLRQKVDSSGKWPEMQRFDFLVRTRELTAKEIAERPAVLTHAEYREAIAAALRTLTGKDAPPSAKAWRAALATP